MQYQTTCAVSIKGDRVEKGTVVELEPEVAANLGSDLVLYEATEEVEETPEPEKALDEMSKDELVAKAEALGIKKTGTIADLVERITLHLEGGAEEEVEETE